MSHFAEGAFEQSSLQPLSRSHPVFLRLTIGVWLFLGECLKSSLNIKSHKIPSGM